MTWLGWLASWFITEADPEPLMLIINNTFERAFEFTLSNEGGWSNQIMDHGGPTNWGITLTDLTAFRRRTATIDDLKALTIDEAKDIYKKFYWLEPNILSLSNPTMQIAIFDIGVNQGTVTAIRFAQIAANRQGCHLEFDGLIGPLTIDALSIINTKIFIQDFEALVMARYNQIVANDPGQQVFYLGWQARALRLFSI
jgi:lysozyme family protein